MTMNEDNLTILQGNETCPAVGYQAVNVNVPVTVRPFAQTGPTSTKCCGKPIVTSGKDIGQGIKNGICNFTIGQNIVIAIPVAFGAEAMVGDTYVDCLGSSSEEIDCDILLDIVEMNQIEFTKADTIPIENSTTNL